MKYDLPHMTLNEKYYKHIMRPIVNFGLAMVSISSTFHTAVGYGPRSIGSIGLSVPILIQGAGQIAFLVKHHCKPTTYIPLLHANLSIIQHESVWGGRILEVNYPENQQWLHTDPWIHEVCKFISMNHIHIYHLVTDVPTQHAYDTCLMLHLSLNGNFTTSELRAINRCSMSKGVFFISIICNHQGTCILKLAVDNYTTFSLLHDFNWPSKHYT